MRPIPEPTEFIQGKTYYFSDGMEDSDKFRGNFFSIGNRFIEFIKVVPFEPSVIKSTPNTNRNIYELPSTKEEYYEMLRSYLDDLKNKRPIDRLPEFVGKKAKKFVDKKEYIMFNGGDEYIIVTYYKDKKVFNVKEYTRKTFDRRLLRFYEPNVIKDISRRIFETKTRIGDKATLDYLTSFLGGKTHRNNNARQSTRRTKKFY